MRVRVKLCVLLAAIVLGVTVVSGVNADPSSGAISGVVSDASTGQPLANIAVSAYDPELEYEPQAVCTASDGSFTIPDLASDTYTVSYSPASGSCKPSPPTYMDQRVTATVTAPAITSLDAALEPSGAISGTVTGGPNDGPIADSEVDVDTSSGASAGSACSGESGDYTVGGLAAGTDTVEFTGVACGGYGGGGFLPEYDGGASSESEARAVSVSVGSITGGIGANLSQDPNSPDGLITGTVTNRVTGAPVAGVPVEAMGPPMTYGTDQTVCTGTSGGYVVGGLPPGSYSVVLDTDDRASCGGGAFIPEIYAGIDAPLTVGGPDAYPGTNATPVAVDAGTTAAAINGTLAPAGTISGQVTNAGTGGPAGQVLVEVYDSVGDAVGSDCTQADGSYTTTILPSGTYRVGFETDPDSFELCLGRSNTYLPQYFDSRGSLTSAATVTVQAPADVTGIDARLASGASISGTVTLSGDANPGAADPAEADLLDAAGNVVATGEVFQDGGYTIGAVEPGRYTLRFTKPGLESEYYPGTPVEAAATPLQLGPSTALTGINGTLFPATDVGSISGTVTDAVTRQPVSGVVVGVARAGGPLEGTAITTADGEYTVSGVSAGSYQVAFADPTQQHLPEFSRDSATKARATPVSERAGEKLTGIDAALVRPKSVTAAALIAPPLIPVTSARTLNVSLACPGTAACAGRVQFSALRALTAAGRTARRAAPDTAVTSRFFSVRTGRVEVVRFTLSPSQFSRLVRMHRAYATVTVRERGRTVRYPVSVGRQHSHASRH